MCRRREKQDHQYNMRDVKRICCSRTENRQLATDASSE